MIEEVEIAVKRENFKESMLNIIDFFYPLFKPFMDIKTFRYMACGGANTVFDIFLYFISYNYILDKKVIQFTPRLALSPHIGAFVISFSITFPLGFFLMRNLVFTGSVLKGKTQLVRYFSVAMLNILLNYVFLKIFVEHLHFFPTPSKVIITGIMIAVSYLLQRNFTFK